MLVFFVLPLTVLSKMSKEDEEMALKVNSFVKANKYCKFSYEEKEEEEEN